MGCPAGVKRAKCDDPGMDGRPSLALTFDNLGEVADHGPDGSLLAPTARHPSVAVALPRLLERLAELELTATFCVEAANCELNPDALLAIGEGGHELAHHGWRHEDWGGLEPARERELLERGLDAFAALGIDVTGFRPPGGRLARGSVQALQELGFRWCSPAGEEPVVHGELVELPFRWPLVDAYHLLPAVRSRGGGTPFDGGPETLAATFEAELAQLAERGGVRTAIFHPFLLLDPQGGAAIEQILTDIGELASNGTVWVGPAGELAAQLR